MAKKKRPALNDDGYNFEAYINKKPKSKRPALYDQELPAVIRKHESLLKRDENGLTPRELSYCRQYLISYNRIQAAIDAGFPPFQANNASFLMMQRPHVRAYIDKMEREQHARFEITSDDILREHYKVLVADPNSLMEIRRIPCRYCWGENNQYQRTDQEMETDLASWELGRRGLPFSVVDPNGNTKTTYSAWNRGKKNLPFDDMGGVGYTTNKPPNEECTANPCHGNGIMEYHIKDSRFLTSDGKALFAGFKVSKGSIEVLTRSKDASLDFLTKRFQLDKKAITEFDPENMSDDELDAVLSARIKRQQIEHDED